MRAKVRWPSGPGSGNLMTRPRLDEERSWMARYDRAAHGSEGQQPAADHARVLGLRPHARAARRSRAGGRDPHALPAAQDAGVLLPDAAPQRVRRLRDVAVVVRAHALPGAPALRRDPGLPLAHVPARLDLREREERDHLPRAASWEARRDPRIPDDRAAADPRHPPRPPRPAGEQP